MSLLEDSWEQREERVYPELFGGTGEGIYPLDASLFKNQFGIDDIDPRWLHFGVFKCAPTSDRKTWVYVTSGMSNTWESDAPQEYSGFGTEFILETEVKSDCAINTLRSLVALNILVSVGHYGEKPLIDYGDRIPMKIEPNISSLMVVKPIQHPEYFDLESGRVDILQIAGITAQELEYAKANGSEALALKLFESEGSFALKPERFGVI
ncbi:suppressor of fused domain protein [Pseudoalteromonas luteoviolacea]|uniref:suppressor of fused domain protein n=1 Tax=Pseudoalteromonas luteoviolacea TaxID=43657 RepID=UPI001F1F4826|nr:suppressor of fused domain protein [Pseudoalteromonas luteoviolacea]MCF6443066.1 suppressor of fused domain protein [Pseudoalteromonas luteoviolacea]